MKCDCLKGIILSYGYKFFNFFLFISITHQSFLCCTRRKKIIRRVFVSIISLSSSEQRRRGNLKRFERWYESTQIESCQFNSNFVFISFQGNIPHNISDKNF